MVVNIFTGPNIDLARKELLKNILKLKDESQSSIIRIEEDDKERFYDLLKGNSLFGDKNIFFVDGVSWGEDFLNDHLIELNGDEKFFFFLFEKGPSPDLEKKIKKAKIALFVFNRKENSKEFSSNFAMADAFGIRDKKKLWVLYQLALRRGAEPEEMTGVLFWQIKTIMLYLLDGGKTLSPFVKSKASRFAKNYSSKEINTHLKFLLEIYHKSHRGEMDFKYALERFILSL